MNEIAKELGRLTAEWQRNSAERNELRTLLQAARAERDAEILKRLKTDEPIADWCPDFGVRPQRIYQIRNEAQRGRRRKLRS